MADDSPSRSALGRISGVVGLVIGALAARGFVVTARSVGLGRDPGRPGRRHARVARARLLAAGGA